MIPEKIKICGITYDVIQKESDVDLKPSGNVWGEITYSKTRICLENNVSSEYKEQTLVHEIVHGILNAMGKHELNSDEQFVETFSQVLYQVIKENKPIF